MITRVHVTNFKTLRDIELTLGRRNVLVGPNMSGKSNFISVLRFLQRMVLPAPGVHGLTNAITSMGGFEELAWRGGTSNLITFHLAGDVQGAVPGEGLWEYRLDILGGRGGQVLVQSEILRIKFATGWIDLIGKDAASGRRVLRNEQGAQISLIDADRSALEYEVPDWPGNALRMRLASTRFYQLVPQAIKQVNQASAPGALDEHGSNFSSWLMLLQTRYGDEVFGKINSVARDVLPELTDLRTWPTGQATVFLAAVEKSLRTPVPLWHMSDGEVCFIALLSLLLCPEELGAPLYCVEEPENYLHPRLIATLAQLDKQRQEELGAGAAQAIVSTHSLHLVDQAKLEDLIVFERQAGATVCTRPAEREHLRELLRREDVGLGELYYSGALGSA